MDAGAFVRFPDFVEESAVHESCRWRRFLLRGSIGLDGKISQTSMEAQNGVPAKTAVLSERVIW